MTSWLDHDDAGRPWPRYALRFGYNYPQDICTTPDVSSNLAYRELLAANWTEVRQTYITAQWLDQFLTALTYHDFSVGSRWTLLWVHLHDDISTGAYVFLFEDQTDAVKFRLLVE